MKKGKVIGLLAMSAVLLTGCVDSMPDLTAEQSDIIAEYAAGLLLKYSHHYDYKIVSEEEVAAAKAEQQELQEIETQEETEPETDVQTEPNEVSQDTANDSEETQQKETEANVILAADDTDFAAELGIDDLILRYQSFELCDSYPQDNTGFSVDAAQDKKLLIVHFDLEGSPEEDLNCNMFDYNIKMHLNINDSVSVTALSTMLPDELMTFMDVLPAGELVDVVAVAEVDNMTESEISSLILQVSSSGGNCTAKLK